MKKMSSVCDYFVIASGSSTTHVRAIADHISRKMRDKGQRLGHIEGEREASWILLDFGDVVAHVFLDETRRFYDLERLWKDAPMERFEEKAGAPKRVARRAPARKKSGAKRKR
jgi:ribosome-associated protein